MVDRTHTVIPKESGENSLQHLAVRQHIGDAAGDAQIILEHSEASVGQSHQVGPANADVNTARHWQPTHLPAEMPAAVNEFAGNDPIGEDASLVIDVLKEKIQRGNALC